MGTDGSRLAWIQARFGRGVHAVAEGCARDTAVRWARLFGSRARGNARERSDIDLAVCCPDQRAWFGLIEAVDKAPTLLKIGLLGWEDLNRELHEEVIEEGVLLFCALSKPNAA